MHCVANIHDDLYWLGASDRRLAKFENVFPVPRGVSYNSYLVLDEKTVLMDTVDKAVGERFFENLEFALAGRSLDYVVVNHMEPDHCATLGDLLRRWPQVQVVGNAKMCIRDRAKADCAVIYLTEQLAKDMPDVLERYKDDLRPAIILIPGREGSLGIGRDNIQRAIERAVGADIL